MYSYGKNSINPSQWLDSVEAKIEIQIKENVQRKVSIIFLLKYTHTRLWNRHINIHIYLFTYERCCSKHCTDILNKSASFVAMCQNVYKLVNILKTEMREANPSWKNWNGFDSSFLGSNTFPPTEKMLSDKTAIKYKSAMEWMSVHKIMTFVSMVALYWYYMTFDWLNNLILCALIADSLALSTPSRYILYDLE